MLFRSIKYFSNGFKNLGYQKINFRSLYKPKSIMYEEKTAYFHLIDGSDKFKVSFSYVNEPLRVNRDFNFERCAGETIQCFLARVKTNLEKVLVKKKRKKSRNEEDAQSFEIVIELVSSDNNKISDSAICKDIFFSSKYPSGSLTLKIVGIDYLIAINSPWVDSMSLPSSIMAGFPVYANCFETKFADKFVSKFTWMKSLQKEMNANSNEAKEKVSENSDYWIVVGEEFVYIPSVTDIGHKLKLECIPKNTNSSGPPTQKASSSVVQAGPGHCPFENRHLYTKNNTCSKRFRVVSYNILADVYSSTDTAQNELFSYCPTYALKIDYRKQLFLKELLGYNADVVCLQEVDTKVFESDLVPVLGTHDLIGVHAKKSTISEGVSSFYSSSKFKLLEVEEVVLSQELLNKSYCSHILECVDKNSQLKERITGLGTAALALTLQSLDCPEEVLVLGNTHLYFHPDADHIRLLQGGIVMAFLTNAVECVKKKFPRKAVSLVCCGDFNSVPQCGIFKLMTTKHVPADFIDWKSKPEEEVKELSLSQPFNIESACGTPKYTNFTVEFADCLDYIYYQTDRLKVDAVVPVPSDEELRTHKAIPSVVFPSDHIALVADLSWAT